MDTIQALRARLEAHKGRWPAIANAAGVPIDTFRKIAQGKTRNPGVVTVDEIIRALNRIERK